MSKHDFAEMEFEKRQANVRAVMRDHQLDLLLVISPININYLVGWRGKGYQHFQCLFFTLDQAPLVLLSKLAERAELLDHSLADEIRTWLQPQNPIDILKDIFNQRRFRGLRVGLEAPAYYLSPHQYEEIKEFLGNSVLDVTYLIEKIKWVKSPAEIEYIRKAAFIADEGMRSFVSAVSEGRSELEVAAEAHRTMMALGSDSPPSPMNFGSGERCCYSHALPSERRLKRGDFMHNEYGAAYKRYCATIGRVMCLGTPAPRMKEIYQAVRDASDACIAEIRHGVPTVVPHQAVKRVFDSAGLSKYQLHTSGYGIAPGFPPAWGESIHIFEGSEEILKSGMVLSVEPPIYIYEEKLGARLIDNVLVTDDGCEVLSHFPRDLAVL